MATISVILFLGTISANAAVEADFVQQLLRENVVLQETEIEWYSQNMTDKNDDGKKEHKFASGVVSNDCMECICRCETGCRRTDCQYNEVSHPTHCGYFWITEDYWNDCGQPTTADSNHKSDWKKCADNIQCSSQCVQNYMDKYAEKHGCSMNCEGFIREHKGGPDGCKNDKTLRYWKQLQKVKGCKDVL